MKLSKNFTAKEFEDSDYATAHNISNVMGAVESYHAGLLCTNVLQLIRDHYGKPVKISSGFRGLKLNKAIGGARNSQHCEGMAADIKVVGVPVIELFRFCVKNLKFDQCIFEQDKSPNGSVLREWVHISYNEGKNRQEALTRIRVGNEKARYKTYRG